MRTKLGILGAGQLARMMLPTCIDWDIDVYPLDKQGAVCSDFCSNFITGNFQDSRDIIENFKDFDIVTMDLEAVDVEGLKALEKNGVNVRPSSFVIETIQNKFEQKKFFNSHSIPTSSFRMIEKLTEDCHDGILKLPRGGYDGKGVCSFSGDLTVIEEPFLNNVLWEEKVKIKKEISVLLARSVSGEVQCYEPIEMVFNHELNLIDYTLFPARIDHNMGEKLKTIACEIVEKIEYVGVMAVEMFIDINDQIFVNEIAPRPHNSGHHTIESCETGQFENHLRAVLGISLGETSKLKNALTFNVLGSSAGKSQWKNVEALLGEPGVHIHNYGKKDCRVGRKMGHVTITGNHIEELIRKYNKLKELIKVEGQDE